MESSDEAYAEAVLASLEDAYPIGEAAVNRAFRALYGGLLLAAATSLIGVAVLLMLGREEGVVTASAALVGYAVMLLAAGIWLRPWLATMQATRTAEGLHVSWWPHGSLSRSDMVSDTTRHLERMHDPQGETVAVRLSGGRTGTEIVLHGFTRLDELMEAILSRRELHCSDAPWSQEVERKHFSPPSRHLYIALVLLALFPLNLAMWPQEAGLSALIFGAVISVFAVLLMLQWVLAVVVGITYCRAILRAIIGAVLFPHVSSVLGLAVQWHIDTIT